MLHDVCFTQNPQMLADERLAAAKGLYQLVNEVVTLRQKMEDIGEALVLLLAGGIGSRLDLLVGHRAKPAVPFAGLYRIIDFSLSNVMNSSQSVFFIFFNGKVQFFK